MKKFVSMLLILFVFFLVSCGGDSEPAVQEPEENVTDTGNNEIADADEAVTDEDKTEEPDEPVIDEDIVSDDEPEQPEEDQNTPQADPIGNFNLNFSGQINTTISTNSRGGTGTANFTYNEMPNTFGEIPIPLFGGNIFPLAMVNGGNLIIMWLNSFVATEIMSAVEKQVFGIAVPQNASGSGNMKDLGSYAFYGDILINIQGSQFEIKCVRAVSDRGEYDIASNDGANITLTASGDLFDPALAGSMIKYPACE